MGKSFRKRWPVFLLIAAFLFPSCAATETKDTILFTAVGSDCLSGIRILDHNRLYGDLNWEKVDPSWSGMDFYNYWHYRYGGGVYIIDSFEQLTRVADRIETVSNYFTGDERHSLCAEYKYALLKKFPERCFRNKILVALGGVPVSPKMFVSGVTIENDRLQVSLSTCFPENWGEAFAGQMADWEQLVLIPMKRPEQEIGSALVIMERMSEEWDGTGPGPETLVLNWVPQEELFPNLALSGE